MSKSHAINNMLPLVFGPRHPQISHLMAICHRKLPSEVAQKMWDDFKALWDRHDEDPESARKFKQAKLLYEQQLSGLLETA